MKTNFKFAFSIFVAFVYLFIATATDDSDSEAEENINNSKGLKIGTYKFSDDGYKLQINAEDFIFQKWGDGIVESTYSGKYSIINKTFTTNDDFGEVLSESKYKFLILHHPDLFTRVKKYGANHNLSNFFDPENDKFYISELNSELKYWSGCYVKDFYESRENLIFVIKNDKLLTESSLPGSSCVGTERHFTFDNQTGQEENQYALERNILLEDLNKNDLNDKAMKSNDLNKLNLLDSLFLITNDLINLSGTAFYGELDGQCYMALIQNESGQTLSKIRYQVNNYMIGKIDKVDETWIISNLQRKSIKEKTDNPAIKSNQSKCADAFLLADVQCFKRSVNDGFISDGVNTGKMFFFLDTINYSLKYIIAESENFQQFRVSIDLDEIKYRNIKNLFDNMQTVNELESDSTQQVQLNNIEEYNYDFEDEENTKNNIYIKINDPDGYTNVRAGKSSSTEIISQIYDENKLFELIDDSENWWKIKIDSEGNEAKTGFIYYTKVLKVESFTVDVEKAYFHLKPNKDIQNRAYVIKGDNLLCHSNIENSFRNCIYVNSKGDTTNGYVIANQLK